MAKICHGQCDFFVVYGKYGKPHLHPPYTIPGHGSMYRAYHYWNDHPATNYFYLELTEHPKMKECDGAHRTT